MNDLELQALWQAQPRELPTAFSPAELAPRGAGVELVTLTSAFEEERLSRRVRTASVRATFALTVSAMLLLATALLHAGWLAGLALVGLAVLVWQARRAMLDDRALTALRGLRERPGASAPVLLPLAAFAAVMLALLAGVVIFQKQAARRPALALAAALEVCREGATSERVSDDTAAACRRVLDQGALHPEALPAIHDVLERYDCQPHWDGLEALATARNPLVLPAWDALPAACQRRYTPDQVNAASLRAWRQAAARACASALDGGAGDAALRSCESYALVACVAVGHRAPGAVDDLQAEPTLASFFAARARTGAPPWRCPNGAVLAPTPELSFTTPAWPDALRTVLQAWMNGDEARAAQLLEAADVPPGTREDFTREFDAVRKQYAYARERLTAGADAPVDTDTVVRAALDADARFLFRGEPSSEQLRALAQFPRSPRVQLANALGASEYARGKRLADQKDFRGACLAWKHGLQFSRSSLDLLKAATNVCTARARRTLEDAQTCEDLKRVFDYAVDGDGLAEEAQARLAAGSCP